MISSIHFLLQVLACLLYLGTLGFSAPHSSVVSYEGEVSSNNDNVLTKRVLNPPLVMTTIDNYKTYYGWVNHPVASMTEADIAAYAEAGYERVSPQFSGRQVLVTAIFLPGHGLLVASKPRTAVAAKAIADLGTSHCGAWFELVLMRMTTEATTEANLLEKIEHAEDHAIVRAGLKLAEKKQWKSGDPPIINMGHGKTFETGTHAVTWGKYTAADTVGLKPACGDGVPSRLDPHCKYVLTALNVASSR